MKKTIIAVLAMLTACFSLTACGELGGFISNALHSGSSEASVEESSSVEEISSEEQSESSMEASSSDVADSSESSVESSSDSSDEGESYTYTAFTSSEKNLFIEYVGEVIPFVANNEYYVEEYELDWGTEYEIGVNFYTYGNTQAEFDAYKASFSGYTFTGTDVDEYGDAWYYYEKADFFVDMSYYNDGTDYVIDVYAYCLKESNTDEGGGETGEYTYTDFTESEKELFTEYFGWTIPFAPNNSYYVEEYTYYYEEDDATEVGLNFYTYDNTQAEFDAYKALFTGANGYTSDGTDVDEYGDTWYYYSKGDYYIDLSYYTDGADYYIDVYVYELVEGNVGGSDTDEPSNPADVDLITNAGKGLPTDVDGVYDVDFTKASNVKDVTDLYYYIDGCPTMGNSAVLVIPVEFSDVTAASKGYTIENIEKAFNGSEANATYYSVWEYYYLSSYGKLDLDITVLDSWFKPKYASSYYAKSVDADGYANGDQLIIDEALAALEGSMDLSKFDSDGNTVIDAIVIVNTLDVDDSGEDIFRWAYRYWNTYTDGEGYFYEYDGVSANDYLWAPYQFMHETYDEDGNTIYDKSVINTYTFIHEFGHVLGADDYYDTAYVGAPMDGCDIMDMMIGDHNPYTKFNYGWLTSSRLVVAEESVTLTLEDFSKNGDTIIIANNWDESLGVYQEYYVVMYYTNTELNSEAMGCGYFARDGIVVYHVNASMYKEIYDGEAYYFVYNNNTDASDPNGTVDNLIEFVKSPEDTFTYVAGDSSSASIKDSQGNTIAYTFTVDSMTEDVATLTFTKNN